MSEYNSNILYSFIIFELEHFAPPCSPPLSISQNVVHGNIQDRIVECHAGSFYTEDVNPLRGYRQVG